MNLQLIKNRMIWWPTGRGWVVLLILLLSPVALWWFAAESFFGVTRRVPAEVLIVEGWLDEPGLHAVEAEFASGHYQYVVTMEAAIDPGWVKPVSFADAAKRDLVKAGVPENRILSVPPIDPRISYESASAVKRGLDSIGFHPTGVMVFSQGIHARMNAWTFRRALPPNIEIGVIAWHPAEFDEMRWWHSSERARALVAETSDFFCQTILGLR